jgi:hypothetical protein
VSRVICIGFGRKKLNIPFNLLSEALKLHRSTELAARELGCSVGYIYQELKKKGLKPGDVIKGDFVENL